MEKVWQIWVESVLWLLVGPIQGGIVAVLDLHYTNSQNNFLGETPLVLMVLVFLQGGIVETPLVLMALMVTSERICNFQI